MSLQKDNDISTKKATAQETETDLTKVNVTPL